MLIRILCTIFVTHSITTCYAQQAEYTLTVRVHGIQQQTGSVRAVLHNSSASFPRKAEHAVAKQAAPVTDTVATVRFTALPPDTYAVVLLHDRNDNRKMDYSLVGLPKEAYGVSNNRAPKFRPPSYDDARFILVSDTTIHINLIQ